MAMELVVTQPFADHRKGDTITESDAMDAAQKAAPHCVVRRTKPEPPAPPAVHTA